MSVFEGLWKCTSVERRVYESSQAGKNRVQTLDEELCWDGVELAGFGS